MNEKPIEWLKVAFVTSVDNRVDAVSFKWKRKRMAIGLSVDLFNEFIFDSD